MNLVWTYNSNVTFDTFVGEHTDIRKIILINYYIHSINTAKSFGYHTIIYCSSDSIEYFKNIVDELIILDSYENSKLWDCFKIYVLENRSDDFYLIDGDVILHDKLPIVESDIIFDSYEMQNAFKVKYKEPISELTKLGINNIINDWVDVQIPIISTGIYTIKNLHLKNEYISNWKLYNSFVSNIGNLNNDSLTMIGAQYLLTILAKSYSHHKLSNFVGEFGKYYKHYCGGLKYHNPIVPSTYLIDIHSKRKLL